MNIRSSEKDFNNEDEEEPFSANRMLTDSKMRDNSDYVRLGGKSTLDVDGT